MLITRLKLKNWRNFKSADVRLRERQFLIGPNASGKSNFLDVFRFLRDLAKREGGGIQKAVKDRGGLPKIRSLAARQDPTVSIDVSLSSSPDDATPAWRYELGLGMETAGLRRPLVKFERVWRSDTQLVNRPDKEDKADSERLTQTSLEQLNANVEFREIADFFRGTTYLHLVPQLLRFGDAIQGRILEDDPFGQGFLERIARQTPKTRDSRLKRIGEALKIAVPQFKNLEFFKDGATGRPHLQATYTHWRPNAGRQLEDQFSDGTLRLLGLMWALLEGDSLLLLEEPELSLNPSIVRQLPALISRMQTSRKIAGRQILVSTHSDAILSDTGISGDEVLMLTPGSEETEVRAVSDIEDLRGLLENGFSVADAALPRTGVQNARDLLKAL